MNHSVKGVPGVEDSDYSIEELREAYNVNFGHTYDWLVSPLTEPELAQAIIEALKSGQQIEPLTYPQGAML